MKKILMRLTYEQKHFIRVKSYLTPKKRVRNNGTRFPFLFPLLYLRPEYMNRER